MNARFPMMLALLISLVGCISDPLETPFEVDDDLDGDKAQIYTKGEATLQVPPGAASPGFVPTIERVSAAGVPRWAHSAGIVADTLHRFEPSGTTFAAPVDIVLAYDPAALGEIDPGNLRLVWLDHDNQRLVTMGNQLDPVAHTVLGQTTHFSDFAIAPQCLEDADCGEDLICLFGGCFAEFRDL